MGFCVGDRYREVGRTGGCGGSQGGGRNHRELAGAGQRTGLTCKESEGGL